MSSDSYPGNRYLLGVDTGGTFTDFVLYDGDTLRVHKVLSTPDAPERAILQGIAELGLHELEALTVVHGSTVATNAVLEGKGVRTAFVTNVGFADLLSLGRQARPELYRLQPAPPPVPVPPELCLEVEGRMGANGTLVTPQTAEALHELRARLVALAPEAVAINLLFSFLDPALEMAVARMVPEGIFVSRSSDVLPEQREYERGIATWLNAWVGPKVQGYLRRLGAGLQGASLSVMQSTGETVDADRAGHEAVRLLLSGPAGGLAGARFVAGTAGHERLLTFDMGGTSTDVALLMGEPRLGTEGRIGPWPVAVPMVEIHTIGAGGGSIARVDSGGMLQVGPASAGAAPGPACYGRGGTDPTVTDANLVLGRLRADAFLGGGMRLDLNAATAAVQSLARRLGLGVEETALGIVRIADEHMARALRVVSVQRGIDPRELILVPFGGAGGLHVCALAESLGMTRALVPAHAGVLSALGMLVSPRGRQLSQTRVVLLEARADRVVDEELQRLEKRGLSELAGEGVEPHEAVSHPSVDLRYRGQSYTLNLPWRGTAAAAVSEFHDAHEHRFGHRLALPVELVNVRLGMRGPSPRLRLATAPEPGGPPKPAGSASLHGMDKGATIWHREALPRGFEFDGPALVVEKIATTYVAPGWRCRVDPVGNLFLEHTEGQ